jgi:molecular chaperone GrpE
VTGPEPRIEPDKAGPARDAGPAREPVVIKDKRKIDETGQPRAEGQAGPTEPSMGQSKTAEQKTAEQKTAEQKAAQQKAAESTADSDVVAGEVVTEEGPVANPVSAPVQAELAAVRTELEERVRDLQRVSAEYANYRKRVDRDRGAVLEQATAAVISSLLPILDDLDRAREHDDLVGPAAAMAEQLTVSLAKFGLVGFGEVGDPFDPTRHDAVSHETSADVTEPTCTSVMRRGYLLGDRLLRAALVGVADPQ